MKRNMNTYICVRITNYSTVPSVNDGAMYTAVESCRLRAYTPMTYADAKKQLVKLAVQYNLPIKRRPNSINPTIVTYEISGFLD